MPSSVTGTKTVVSAKALSPAAAITADAASVLILRKVCFFIVISNPRHFAPLFKILYIFNNIIALETVLSR